MTTHPNRGRGLHPGRAPKPTDVLAARKAAGLTQTAAAQLIYCTLSAWQRWEQGEREMHPAFLDLFRRKAADLPKTAESR